MAANPGTSSHSGTMNPFAIKVSVPSQRLTESIEGKESRPLVAPPTLKLGPSDSSSSTCSSSAATECSQPLSLPGTSKQNVNELKSIKESRPLVAPPTLKLGSSDSSSSTCSSSAATECSQPLSLPGTSKQYVNELKSKKESRPLVAPPTLKLGLSDSSSSTCSSSAATECSSPLSLPGTSKQNVTELISIKDSSSSTCSSSATTECSQPLSLPGTSKQNVNELKSKKEHRHSRKKSPMLKTVLRPSPLAAQAEKLKLAYYSEEVGGNSSKNKELYGQKSLTDAWIKMASSFKNTYACSIGTVATIGLSANSQYWEKSDKNISNESSFIFGQNIHARALNYELGDTEEHNIEEEHHNLTFESACKSKLDDQENSDSSNNNKSLSESAKEYESKQVKRKFDEIVVVTGEEEESNVLQVNCKLFTFDKNISNWQDKGRGILRLNDKECDGVLQSRVVMRTQGSLRVMLNTKVWSGMAVELPSQTTVRLTAVDSEGVKVYLVMAHPKDADQLCRALNWRIATLKSREDITNKSGNFKESLITESINSVFDISSDDSCTELIKKRSRLTLEEIECADSSSAEIVHMSLSECSNTSADTTDIC